MATPEHDVRPDQERTEDELEAQRANRDRQHYDNFRESVAAPVPNRTYRSDVDLMQDRPSTSERVIRYVAVVLCALLAIRFVINLFVSNTTGGFTGFIYALTNWAVRPFQLLFGQPTVTSGGFFDWPALAAIIAVGIIASIVIALIRPKP